MTRVPVQLGVVHRWQLFWTYLGDRGGSRDFKRLVFGFRLAFNGVFGNRWKLTVAEQVLNALASKDVGKFDVGESLTLPDWTGISRRAVGRVKARVSFWEP